MNNLTEKELAMYMGCQFIGKYNDWDCENLPIQLTLYSLLRFQKGEYEYIKLLLRPLSSMTEEEGIEILKLALAIKELNGKVEFISETHEAFGHTIKIKYFGGKSKLVPSDVIEINSSGDLVDDHGHFCHMVKIVDFYNQNGFDTRGWIDSGKAIDRTKLK